MGRNVCNCIAVIVLFIATLAFGKPVHEVTRTIALTGQRAPGTGEGLFSSFGRPSINDRGDIAFKADIVEGTAHCGIFLARGKSLLSIALVGERDASGTSSFVNFGNPVINETGQIVFFARTGKGIRLQEAGIFLHSGSASAAIARTGNPAPGTGGKFTTLGQMGLDMNSSGTVTFHASYDGARAGEGIFRYSNGAITPVALKGDSASDSPTERFGNFSGLAINGTGQIGFVSWLTGGSTKGAAFVAENDRRRIVRAEGQLTAAANRPFGALSEISISEVGDLAFVVNHANPEGRFKTIAPTGVVMASGDEMVIVAREKTTTPQLFGGFREPIIIRRRDGSNAVLFRAWISARAQNGLILYTKNGLELIIADGERVDGGALYSGLSSTGAAASGEFAFVSGLKESSARFGLFAGRIEF